MSEWVNSTIGKVTAYQKAGGTPLVSESRYYGGGIPFVTIEDMTRTHGSLVETERSITPAGLANSAAWLIEEPHVLYSMYATVGKPVVNQIACATNQAIIALRENDEILMHWLYYWLEKLRPEVWKYTAQTTQANLSAAVVRKLPISYPKSMEKQAKVVAVLEAADSAIETTEALIHKYQRIKAGLMHDLFTRGIGPDGQMRPPRDQAPELYQETPIGWIPKGWAYDLLDTLADRVSGHTPSKSHPEYWNGGVKWISLADSHRLDNRHIEDTEYEISSAGLANSSAVLHPAGTVVLSRDAGVGKSAITAVPMAVSQHFMAWKCTPKLDNEFLYYWLQTNKRYFENIAMGSTILTIGLSYFKKLRIACPANVDEQLLIAQRLRATDTKISQLRRERTKLGDLRAGLMADLLSSAEKE